jgi:hypothetical protein
LKYSVIRPPYATKILIDTAAKVAARELHVGPPDDVYCVMPDPDGKLEGPSNANGWYYPLQYEANVFVVAERPPRSIVNTVFHELYHYADGLKYNSVTEVLANKEASERKAHAFAAAHTKDLPEEFHRLLAALQERAFRQKYPIEHAAALVFAQRELERITSEISDDDDDFYDEVS